MNHDATHCTDYSKSRCPKSCYRAQLTQDLFDNWLRFRFLPMSWSNYRLSEECPLHINDNVAKIETEVGNES